MKYIIATIFLATALGCSNASTPVAQNANVGPVVSKTEKSQTAIAHGPQNQSPNTAAPGEKSKWTQGGDPIDTTELDAAIKSAEAAFKAKSSDDAAKKALASAYYKRAEALTGARQYASALGDYRRALKHDPANSEAKEWIERIISIYDSIGRDSPKDGEEPLPLPFSKGK